MIKNEHQALMFRQSPQRGVDEVALLFRPQVRQQRVGHRHIRIRALMKTSWAMSCACASLPATRAAVENTMS